MKDIIETHITECVSAILEDIKDKLLERNVSKEIIDDIFGHTTSARPRLLHSNTSETPIYERSDADHKKKLRLDWSDRKDVVLIIDYTDKSYAIFGDFDGKYSVFKAKFLTKNSKEVGGLAFGSGYTIFKNADKLSALQNALKTSKIAYRTIKRKDFEDEILNPPPLIDTTATISTVTKPIQNVKEKITKNKYGNFEGETSGLVFEQFPLGENGKKQNYVIGIQNPQPPKGAKSYDAILPLSIDGRNEAKTRGYRILTLADIDKLKTIDKEKATIVSNLAELNEPNEAVSSGSSDDNSDDDEEDQ